MQKQRSEKPNGSSYMRVRIEDGLDSAGDAFAVEILKAIQFWQDQPRIIIQLCTGESPFIGYRKIAGDRVLEERGLYNPEEFAKGLEKYGRFGAILDTWDSPRTQDFLKENGVDSSLKPDMNKLVVFALDAIFPQKRGDYFAFAKLLNNICGLWAVPSGNRNLFYGDVYVDKERGQWKVSKIPDEEYKEIIESIDREGLRFLEYQAACLFNGDNKGFALNSVLRVEGDKAFAGRLKRDIKGDFTAERVEIDLLDTNHLQYKYLESMRNQALMMYEKLTGLGGPHIALLGVGPSYEGEGHIGFCEKDTPPEQTCFIGAINDFDAAFHICGAHAKEFYGFKKMFVSRGEVRMPKFGFITYGPAEIMYRRGAGKQRDVSKEVIVIVIATGNSKSRSIARAIEGGYDCHYPLSLIQNCRGVYVLDRTAARELRIEKYPWEFQVLPEEYWTEENIRRFLIQFAESVNRKISVVDFESVCADLDGQHLALVKSKQEFQQLKEGVIKEILSGVIRPGQVIEKLKEWNLEQGDTILLINPHMDDDFLAMMHILKEMAPHYNIHACYISLGYTAVYSDYVLGLIDVASRLEQSEIDALNPDEKEKLLKDLVREGETFKRVPKLDYEVLPYMSREEIVLRAKLLLIDLNERYDLKGETERLFTNKFRSRLDLLQLKEFLAEVEKRKPQGGGLDLDIMRFLKTSARFMEAVSGLMSLGVPYKNIYWPLDVSFYGTPGRALAIKEEDVRVIKEVIKAVAPKMVVLNGESFPDFGSHSNTEIGTCIALFSLIKEGAISEDILLLQWAGVWDRIGLGTSKISVVLTKEELQAFYDAFNFFY
ncbi:MAG: hypothetical protein ABH914_02855, partial [Candidatus Omnitrophota bacterium]